MRVIGPSVSGVCGVGVGGEAGVEEEVGGFSGRLLLEELFSELLSPFLLSSLFVFDVFDVVV